MASGLGVAKLCKSSRKKITPPMRAGQNRSQTSAKVCRGSVLPELRKNGEASRSSWKPAKLTRFRLQFEQAALYFSSRLLSLTNNGTSAESVELKLLS